MAKKSKPNEIQITRLYDAPVKTVWEAFTEPKHVAKWWGPRGFTLTTHSKDLRPGGIWHYTMHGPDGADWINKTLYHEVEKYSKLRYDHGGNDEQAPLFQVTVYFIEQKDKTLMEMTMAFSSAQVAEESKKFIKQAGGNSTWDRLAEFLEKESTGQEKFVINRSFEAPIEVLFDIWTKPEHFAKWLPPTGMEMSYKRSEIKEGSSTLYVMKGHGMTLHGHINYIKIDKPNQIVYTQDFCDENEKPSRHPGLSAWPATMLTTVELTSEGDNETRVTVTWEPQAPYSTEDLAAFVKEKPGMTQGWTGSFDKLEELLKK